LTIDEVVHLDPPGQQASRPSWGVKVEWPVLDAAAVKLGLMSRMLSGLLISPR
jgi:hypothetical protein